MAASVIIGVEGLRNKFLELKSDMVSKTSLRMVASAGGVLRKEAKAIAQSYGLKKSGALIRNIAIKRERKPEQPGTTQYNLGVRHGRALGNGKKVTKFLEISKRSGRVVVKRENDPFYWKFLEFDTRIRRGTSFIQQSLANKSEQALKAMQDRLEKDLIKAKL